LRLLACTHGVENEVKARMKGRFGITLTQFNLLAQLERSPGGIRMGELSRRTMVTGSNVTVVIDDLVSRGLAGRQPAPGDRRAIVITLTEAGRTAFAEMAAEHESWIREMLGSLPANRKLELMSGLDDLKAALRVTLRNSL
jgi:DNA-binding MarR family transcriptional regulator